MNLIDKLLKFLESDKHLTPSQSPEGFCPNCWGRQEYGGQFFEAIKVNAPSLNTKDSNIGWIQDYVNKNLTEIVLRPKNHELVCNKCKVAYKQT
ncbi:hypothetical protein DZC72_06630 [Maribacter algicola]|uniref:Uncharacterized protein n=1 Tax=Maribacter algicola TaxID=2498892 RepID=A0A3R8S279_9FLAO|nr:hypothetical protein [Maribacter algicola]RRQ50234.1 hypothetical protein DZC72_06630 [Maribacter algicola]